MLENVLGKSNVLSVTIPWSNTISTKLTQHIHTCLRYTCTIIHNTCKFLWEFVWPRGVQLFLLLPTEILSCHIFEEFSQDYRIDEVNGSIKLTRPTESIPLKYLQWNTESTILPNHKTLASLVNLVARLPFKR